MAQPPIVRNGRRAPMQTNGVNQLLVITCVPLDTCVQLDETCSWLFEFVSGGNSLGPPKAHKLCLQASGVMSYSDSRLGSCML